MLVNDIDFNYVNKRKPERMGIALPYEGSTKALYIALYNKSDFENFIEFGTFCCITSSIHKKWYSTNDLNSAFKIYKPLSIDYNERFKAWLEAAKDPDNEKLRHSKKDILVTLRIMFGGCFVDWLEEGVITESFYNREGEKLTLKGIGNEYYLNMFFTSIRGKSFHDNFPCI